MRAGVGGDWSFVARRSGTICELKGWRRINTRYSRFAHAHSAGLRGMLGRRFRVLNETLFLSLAYAGVVIAVWVDDYNQERRYSSFGDAITPAAFAADLDAQWPAPLRSPLLQPRSCATKRHGSNPNWRDAGGHVTSIHLIE